MDAPQNSGQNQNGQNNNNKKPQLSWSQPSSSIKPAQNRPTSSVSTPASSGKTSNNTQSHTMRNISIAVVTVLVIGGIVWALSGGKHSSTDADSSMTATTTSTTSAASTSTTATIGAPSTGTQAAFSSGSLVIPSPQTAGLEIAVSNITVQVPTWVVIYENYNGQPGNVLGAGLFVSGRTSGVVDLLRGTLPGQTYFAGEARDDGDHMFSMANDPAIRDANGNPIVVEFETK